MPFLAAALAADATEVTAVFADPVNALFEAMSGLTSTGLTVSTDPRKLPLALQWWRSTLQWLGGVGILYVAIAAVGVASQGDGSGEEADDELSSGDDGDSPPRLLRSMRRAAVAYAVLTALTFGGLWLAGMPPWDAANHAQTAIATGGFSLSPDSLAAYPRAAQAVAAAAILAGTISFFTLGRLVCCRDWRGVLGDRQIAWLAGFLVLSTLATIALAPFVPPFDAFFQPMTALCTAGFSTMTVNDLPAAALWLLIGLMVLGGGSGSTAGGIKLARLRRLVWLALRRGVRDPVLSEPASKTLKIAALFLATYAVGAPLLWLLSGPAGPAGRGVRRGQRARHGRPLDRPHAPGPAGRRAHRADRADVGRAAGDPAVPDRATEPVQALRRRRWSRPSRP